MLSFLDTLCESQALNLYGHSDRIKRNHDLGHRSVIDCIGDKLLFNLFLDKRIHVFEEVKCSELLVSGDLCKRQFFEEGAADTNNV